MKTSIFLLAKILSLNIAIPDLLSQAFTSNTWSRQKTFGRTLVIGNDNHVKASSADKVMGNFYYGKVAGKERLKTQWLDQSVSYYSKVMREERRRKLGQAKELHDPADQEEFEDLARKHYFALRKIKDGKPRHAEIIYRRIIDELQHEEDGHCDHAKLAVTTLLLALLLQRLGDLKATRSVFLHFFRIAVLDQEEGTECACSAKVMQAFALFEMKQGNARKSFELVKKAIQMDTSLEPVLQWKQFRDVVEKRELLP